MLAASSRAAEAIDDCASGRIRTRDTTARLAARDHRSGCDRPDVSGHGPRAFVHGGAQPQVIEPRIRSKWRRHGISRWAEGGSVYPSELCGAQGRLPPDRSPARPQAAARFSFFPWRHDPMDQCPPAAPPPPIFAANGGLANQTNAITRSEEHTSELQSLMRISYAVFCLPKTKATQTKKAAHTIRD